MTKQAQKISTTEARNNFADIINQVFYQQQEYVITRHDDEMARIVPAEQKSKKTALQQEEGEAEQPQQAKQQPRKIDLNEDDKLSDDKTVSTKDDQTQSSAEATKSTRVQVKTETKKTTVAAKQKSAREQLEELIKAVEMQRQQAQVKTNQVAQQKEKAQVKTTQPTQQKKQVGAQQEQSGPQQAQQPQRPKKINLDDDKLQRPAGLKQKNEAEKLVVSEKPDSSEKTDRSEKTASSENPVSGAQTPQGKQVEHDERMRKIRARITKLYQERRK